MCVWVWSHALDSKISVLHFPAEWDIWQWFRVPSVWVLDTLSKIWLHLTTSKIAKHMSGFDCRLATACTVSSVHNSSVMAGSSDKCTHTLLSTRQCSEASGWTVFVVEIGRTVLTLVQVYQVRLYAQWILLFRYHQRWAPSYEHIPGLVSPEYSAVYTMRS